MLSFHCPVCVQVCCWSHVGEQVTQAYREAYVGAILAQEMGWFDLQGKGTLATRVAELTSKVSHLFPPRMIRHATYLCSFGVSSVALRSTPC